MPDENQQPHPHLTTRRAFVSAAGFGVIALYGLWAGYGAAPLPFIGHSAPPEEEKDHDMEGARRHGEHGAPAGPSPDEFRQLAEQFVAAYRLPDGSVSLVGEALPIDVAAVDHHAMGHGEPLGSVAGAQSALPPVETVAPADVYLMAYRWAYTPSVLRLKANTPYRFRMMAVDIAHGASIQLGRASHMIRLRANSLAETRLTFKAPGEYLVYCTVYCGLGHDRMQGKIIVV